MYGLRSHFLEITCTVLVSSLRMILQLEIHLSAFGTPELSKINSRCFRIHFVEELVYSLLNEGNILAYRHSNCSPRRV